MVKTKLSTIGWNGKDNALENASSQQAVYLGEIAALSLLNQSKRIANLKILFLFFEIIKKPFTFAQSIIYQIIIF